MHHNIEQNTDEWLALRSGHLTGSPIAKVMANYGKSFGDPAQKYAVNIAVEQITGVPIASTYSNAHMERGHVQEPIARAAYEAEFFVEVQPGGFFDNGFTGCSPDGLVDEGNGPFGCIEIKSVIASTQYKCILKKKYDSAYHWQLLFNMREAGSEWIDYISFCMEFPEGSQLFVQRLYAVDFEEDYSKMDERVFDFKNLVSSIKHDILSSEVRY